MTENKKAVKKSRTTLTEKQVKEIRHLWKTGKVTQLALAQKFSYEPGNISRILARKLWKSVK